MHRARWTDWCCCATGVAAISWVNILRLRTATSASALAGLQRARRATQGVQAAGGQRAGTVQRGSWRRRCLPACLPAGLLRRHTHTAAAGIADSEAKRHSSAVAMGAETRQKAARPVLSASASPWGGGSGEAGCTNQGGCQGGRPSKLQATKMQRANRCTLGSCPLLSAVLYHAHPARPLSGPNPSLSLSLSLPAPDAPPHQDVAAPAAPAALAARRPWTPDSRRCPLRPRTPNPLPAPASAPTPALAPAPAPAATRRPPTPTATSTPSTSTAKRTTPPPRSSAPATTAAAAPPTAAPTTRYSRPSRPSPRRPRAPAAASPATPAASTPR